MTQRALGAAVCCLAATAIFVPLFELLDVTPRGGRRILFGVPPVGLRGFAVVTRADLIDCLEGSVVA